MTILLIGDAIIDRYVQCETKRVSPEAPIPVFNYLSEKDSPGGVYNVYENIKALGSRVDICTGSTSYKTRYVCDNKIVFRVDDDADDGQPAETFYTDKKYEHVVLVDYRKGTVDEMEKLIEFFTDSGSKVIVDAKGNLEKCRGAWMVKMNHHEFFREYMCDPAVAAREYEINYLVITSGAHGLMIYGDLYGHFPAEKVDVSDVTGAGDVVTAAIVSALDSGKSLQRALHEAVSLATLSVTKFGTRVLTEEDISSARPKVVFTNGCFDILHKGHIELLKRSKELGGRLIVGINSDESIKRLKGMCRPINDQESRKLALEAIKWVDEVVIFDEDTPYELIKSVEPDVITKGGDYEVSTVVGNDLASVVIIPLVEGFSTTNIVERIRNE